MAVFDAGAAATCEHRFDAIKSTCNKCGISAREALAVKQALGEVKPKKATLSEIESSPLAAAAFNAVGGLDKFDMAALPLPIFPADWQVKQLPTTAAAANALARAASLPARVVKPEPEKPNHFTQPTKRVIVIADLEDG